MSTFSVKKPFTVLVAVILIVILGIVAFSDMTPDLLPKIEMQYAIVVTAYPGASPQEVEEKVSKPIEQQLATLDNLNSINSTSSENYSMVSLKFDDSVNMDTLAVDIREKLNLITFESSMIGTPYIMKINPDMLPVAVTAIAVEGKDSLELTTFFNEKILPELEGVEGVANVSASGLIEGYVNININTEKLAAVNAKLYAAINSMFSGGRSGILSGIDSANAGSAGLSNTVAQLRESQQQLAETISSQQLTLTDSRRQLLEAQLQITEQLTSATEKLAELTDLADNLSRISAQLPGLKQSKAGMISAAMAQGHGATEAEAEQWLTENSADFRTLQGTITAMEQALTDAGVTLETVPAMIAAIEQNKISLAAGITQLEQSLDSVSGNRTAVEQALSQLAAAQAAGSFDISSGLTQVMAGQMQISSTVSKLNDTLDELNLKQSEVESNADLSSILSLDTVSAILSAQNFSMPAGYLKDGDTQYIVTVGDKIKNIDELKGLVLFDAGVEGMDTIYLGDVADIYTSDNSDEVYAKLNGQNGVLVSFTKQSGQATADVSANIAKTLQQLSEKYPGFTFSSLMDQGEYIGILVDSVLENLLIGAGLAIIILFLFLRDLRPTGIIAVSIPVSVMFAIVLMYFSGVTLNVISLSGLAVGVGMLVDNSIVCIENIYRLRSRGYSAARSAVNGARQIAAAITSSTLTTVCVFVPIVFVHGLTKQLFTDMALTVGYSLLASLLVALTVVPALSLPVLKKEINKKNETYERFATKYGALLDRALNKKAIVLITVAALLIISAAWGLGRGFSYMPEMSGMQISVTLKFDKDSAAADNTAAADGISAEVGDIKGVKTVGAMYSSGMSSVIGLSAGTGGNQGITMYVLTDGSASDRDIIASIEQICEKYDCEATVSGASGMSNYASVLGGSGVTVKVYGNDLDEMRSGAEQIAKILSGVEGIAAADSGIGETSPQIKVTVNKNAAMKYNLTVAQVYQKIAAAIKDTATSTEVTDGENQYSIVVQSGIGAVKNADELKNLEFKIENIAGSTVQVKLADIADIEVGTAMQSIAREDGRRVITVKGELAEGYNVTKVSDKARAAVAEQYTAPAGVTIEYSGENETIMSSLSDLLTMLLLGVIIVYLIMVAQFQSLKSPFIVMFTIPLSFTGGLLALCFTGMEVSVIAMIGFIMLVGVVVNNGIVLVDCINGLRLEGLALREAIVEACKTRLRPVLMTALTTILGLLPLALGFGMGAELVQPVAVVCIGGLTYATLMTLFVVPAMYEVFMKKPLHAVSKEDLSEIHEHS